tara:strand:- start:140 stop:451 length:312 start_codon:yes stop_codon:yes gene_type:complete
MTMLSYPLADETDIDSVFRNRHSTRFQTSMAGELDVSSTNDGWRREASLRRSMIAMDWLPASPGLAHEQGGDNGMHASGDLVLVVGRKSANPFLTLKNNDRAI